MIRYCFLLKSFLASTEKIFEYLCSKIFSKDIHFTEFLDDFKRKHLAISPGLRYLEASFLASPSRVFLLFCAI